MPHDAAALDTAAPIAALIGRLYPIMRSITGDGVRETLQLLRAHIDLDVVEVPTGTPVGDWTVPREWRFRSATLTDASGRRVIDAEHCNLHVLNYSAPVRGRFTLDELAPHLLTDPTRPDAVPYRTSYYAERWAFCLSQRQRDAMAPGEYEAIIDTEFVDGSLTYGSFVVPGRTNDEILLTTHICHPSLANDNCAGLAALTAVLASLRPGQLRHTVRGLFIPGTIGSLTWLATNAEVLPFIRHGLVLNNIGDGAPFTYKRSRRGNAALDIIAPSVLRTLDAQTRVVDFEPYGYDERQFCSPGYDLPFGALSRSTYGYAQYHSTADNLDFVQPEKVLATVHAVQAILQALDGDVRYRNCAPHGEPQLGRRGLYSSEGGQVHGKQFEIALLWLLSQSDGHHGLADIEVRSGLSIEVLESAASALVSAGLLEPIVTRS